MIRFFVTDHTHGDDDFEEASSYDEIVCEEILKTIIKKLKKIQNGTISLSLSLSLSHTHSPSNKHRDSNFAVDWNLPRG